MKTSFRVRPFVVCLLLTIIACACSAANAAKLIVNGQTASNDVRIINGKAYAPISDIAKALGMVITKSGTTYKMAPAGGANQIDGALQGKIGSELFTGKWKFQVLGMEIVDEYKERFYQLRRTIKPQSKDEVLLVINCRIKNGVKKARQPVLTERQPGNTALACDNGQSFAPIDYDAIQESDKTQSYAASSLLPGAGMDFALVFSIPKDTKPKALVFTASTYLEGPIGSGTDVRVDLTE